MWTNWLGAWGLRDEPDEEQGVCVLGVCVWDHVWMFLLNMSILYVKRAKIVNVNAFLTAYISAYKYPEHSKTTFVSYKLKLDFNFSSEFAAVKLLILLKRNPSVPWREGTWNVYGKEGADASQIFIHDISDPLWIPQHGIIPSQWGNVRNFAK